MERKTSPVLRRKFSAAPKQQKGQRLFLKWILKHQIQITTAFILTVACLHMLFPQSRPYTRKFFQLSYHNHNNGYTQGMDDTYFVLGWVIYLTGLRAIAIEWVLRPLAALLGVPSPKSDLRFAEQGWLFLYYSTVWALGMHLWYNSDYWLNHAALWTAWPSREMSGPFKCYYLVQLAFCTQQLLSIHMEARRKDYLEMFTHHIITCSLIFITYVYRYTRAANVVLCLMDLVDILLPFAKLLRYLRYDNACNIAFGVFVVTWFVTRHLIYLHLCWDIYQSVPGPRTMLYGCYDGATSRIIPHMPARPDSFAHLFWPFRSLDGVICLNTEVKYIFLGMLLLLHTLSLIWFVMILKVIGGILLGKSAEDIRSDDEGGEKTLEDLNPCTRVGAEPNVHLPVETSTMTSRLGHELDLLNPCTGVGSVVVEAPVSGGLTKSRAKSNDKPTSTRRRLIDTENRKEFLAKIGCEKPI